MGQRSASERRSILKTKMKLFFFARQRFVVEDCCCYWLSVYCCSKCHTYHQRSTKQFIVSLANKHANSLSSSKPYGETSNQLLHLAEGCVGVRLQIHLLCFVRHCCSDHRPLGARHVPFPASLRWRAWWGSGAAAADESGDDLRRDIPSSIHAAVSFPIL